MNNSSASDELNVTQRHKKERRELQAKVQALKKSVNKDKKRKKEVTDEILRLERELDDKHSKECTEHEIAHVQSIELNENNLSDTQSTEKEKSTKISKAQKRRDKKANEERERVLRIIEQEAQNINGPRNAEINTIKAILKKKSLSVYNVPSDGDCLYKAIAHQLEVTACENVSVYDLRQRSAAYIRENKEDFIPFMSNTDGDVITDFEFEDYCSKISETHTWGGQIEVRALSNLLKRPVHIIQAVGPEVICQGENFQGIPLVITYHRHMYSLGEHYNSTQTLVVEADSEFDCEEQVS